MRIHFFLSATEIFVSGMFPDKIIFPIETILRFEALANYVQASGCLSRILQELYAMQP
jgi:hypothetical protein